MATLVKLGIRGIRAFSPANLEVLTFQKPLTLIVGHNGAGKTTIVECLKMASCGELPPFANRGHNFVHDTKVADQPEVKAQIRLQLATLNRQYTLTRNFMVSSTRGRTGDVKTTFKALDSVCSTLDLKTNVKTSASYKCSDMDKHAPSLLGLSKALIENVIFVHQEDSNWPLSDQATLKKKFDEVFGSTRYTKALETINSHMKEFSKMSKEALHQLELAESVLGQARNLEHRIGEIHAEAEQLRQQKQSWQTQLALFERDLASSAETLKALGDVESVLSFKTHLLDEKKSQYTTLVSAMKEDFQEGGEELLQLKAELEAEVEQCHGKEDVCTRRIVGLEVKRDELAYKAREAEKERRVAILNKERRDDALRERNAILLKLEIAVVKDVNVVEQVMAMRRKLELSSGQVKERARVALQSKADECRRVRSDLQTVEVRRRCLENDRDASIRKRGQLEMNVSRLRQVEHELIDIGQQTKCEAQADNKVVEELQSRLVSLRDERSLVEEQLREANVRLRAAEGVAAVRHGLKVLVDSKSRLAETLRETYQRVQTALGEPLDENWTPKRVDFDLVAARRSQLEAERSSLALQAEQANKSVGALDSQIADVRKRMTDYQKRVAELTPPEGVTNPESLASLLAEKRQTEESCLRNVLVNQNAERMFSSFMAHSVKKHKCAFCTRPFRKDAEVEAMKSHLESRITSLPALIHDMEAELAVVRSEIQSLDACGPVVAELFDVQKALPTLRTALKEAELKRKRQMELLPYCIARLEALQSKVNSVDTALGEGKSFGRTWQQYEATCRDVLQVQSQLIDAPSPTAARSLVGELEDRLDAIPLKQVRTEFEDALSARRSLEEQQHTLGMRRARLEQEQDSLKDSETALARLPLDETGELAQVLTQEAKLSRDVSEADTAVAQCQEAFNRVEAIHAQKTSLLDNTIEKIRQLNDRISECEARHVDTDCGHADAYDTTSADLEVARATLKQLRETNADNRDLLSSITHNLRVREVEGEVKALETEVKATLDRCHNQDPCALRREVDRLTQEASSFREQINMADGQLKAKDDFRNQLVKERQSSKFSNIETRHSEALLDSELFKLTVNDLGRYHKALDKALMAYHANKMREINKALKEYWQVMYRGRDIEYVAIRSDTESSSTLAGSRSYNYRLVMCVAGVELDMRGRCSAGQKVLVCIVVRLTLADCFGAHCGILALDEPTTNLDHENILGLSRALADLIEVRGQYANFQLLLITHDEQFVSNLARFQLADSFVKVEKNQKGHSVVHERPFRQL